MGVIQLNEANERRKGITMSKGKIQAKDIKAENVVQGFQQLGGELTSTAEIVALAEGLLQGSIQADSIEAQNVVSGWQYIAKPSQVTLAELRQEVAQLRQQLAQAIATGEITADANMTDAQEALDKAEQELAQSQPQGSRVVRKLKEVADILIEGAKTTEAAQQAGQALLKLAPIAATIYQIGLRLLGG